MIFAKSFKKKINKFEDRKVHCGDLKDIEKAVKHRKITHDVA